MSCYIINILLLSIKIFNKTRKYSANCVVTRNTNINQLRSLISTHTSLLTFSLCSSIVLYQLNLHNAFWMYGFISIIEFHCRYKGNVLTPPSERTRAGEGEKTQRITSRILILYFQLGYLKSLRPTALTQHHDTLRWLFSLDLVISGTVDRQQWVAIKTMFSRHIKPTVSQARERRQESQQKVYKHPSNPNK